MENETFLKRALLGSVVMATVANLGVHAASASIINSSSSAFDVSGTLTVAGFLPVSLTLNPVATAMGSGAASYSNGGIASAGLNQSLSVLGTQYANLTSSPNTATASFDASSSKANASATGTNVNLNFLGSGNSNVLSLAVPSFTSTATVSGDYGALAANGGASLASDTKLSAFGQNITLAAKPTANQTIPSRWLV